MSGLRDKTHIFAELPLLKRPLDNNVHTRGQYSFSNPKMFKNRQVNPETERQDGFSSVDFFFGKHDMHVSKKYFAKSFKCTAENRLFTVDLQPTEDTLF